MLTTAWVALVLAVSAQTQTDYYPDMDQDDLESNSTVLGEILGGPCEDSCSPDMINVQCVPETHLCECARGFPVRLGGNRGCAEPTNIGDQCFYTQTCMYADQNSDCVQIRHNAVCQCKEGYHTVTIPRPKKVFCSEDLVVIATDLSTLLGVATGLAIFTALICFVLKLFVGGRPRHYANSNLAPPILFAQSEGLAASSRNGELFRDEQIEQLSYAMCSPKVRVCLAQNYCACAEPFRTVRTRTANKSLDTCWEAFSITNEDILQYLSQVANRYNPSTNNEEYKSYHATSTQPNFKAQNCNKASVHSSTSSTKSFSARQFERERENRLLAKARNRERDGTTPSPSPRSTENLLDDPLPSDSWPRTDDEGRDSEAFTPDVLEKGIGGSMAHIDDPLAMAEDNTEPLPSSPPSYEDSEKQTQEALAGPLGPLP